jgi:hypothetical protein
MFFLNVFNIKELQLPMKTNHNNPCPYAWNRQEFIVGNCIRDINKYEVVHLNGVRKSWGVYLLIALIDDDPAKYLPRCTTRKGRVNMSYLQQMVSDVN